MSNILTVIINVVISHGSGSIGIAVERAGDRKLDFRQSQTRRIMDLGSYNNNKKSNDVKNMLPSDGIISE